MFTTTTITDISKQQTSVSQDALDLIKMVDDLIDDISSRFTSVSTELFSKSARFSFLLYATLFEFMLTRHMVVDEMAARLDSLEASTLARDMRDDANPTPKK